MKGLELRKCVFLPKPGVTVEWCEETRARQSKNDQTGGLCRYCTWLKHPKVVG